MNILLPVGSAFRNILVGKKFFAEVEERKLSMANNELPIKISSTEAVTVISFATVSISDSAAIDSAANKLDIFIIENHPKAIVFDFDKVKFFSSQALGLLLRVWRRMQGYGGRVAVSGIEPQLHRVFKITNLDKIFEFFPDSKSAVGALTVG